MAVKTYDPKNVSVIVGGKIVGGFTDGTFINAERNENMFNQKVGVDGIGTRAKSNNRSGKITITLHQSSPSNDDFSAIQIADEQSNSGVVPVLIRDNSGRTLCSALTAWFQKPANPEFGKEVANRVWVLETDELLIFNGGN